MSSTSEKHHKLTNGVGCCSVPMWMNGLPSGFCDNPAYGKRPPCKEYRNAWTRELIREDGRYSGYVPGLACPGHGGPAKPYFDFVCDAPPGPESGRFVEVENALGESISKGEWIKRPDGYWALRITEEPRPAP